MLSCNKVWYETGLGLLLNSTNNGLEIIGTVPGTVAHEGGYVLKNSEVPLNERSGREDVLDFGSFQPGDIITAIDDVLVAGKDRQDVFLLLSEPEVLIRMMLSDHWPHALICRAPGLAHDNCATPQSAGAEIRGHTNGAQARD